MYQSDLNGAFKILIEEFETVLDNIKEEIDGAIEKNDFQSVSECAECAKKVTGFRDKIETLQNEWEQFISTGPERQFKRKKQTPQTPQTPRPLRRLPNGLRTPENAFRFPILNSLIELGGSAQTSKVLDLVYEKMKQTLNEYDHQPLSSPPHDPRWHKTANWCRFFLAQEGFLLSDSPRGVWEITQEGREEAARMKKQLDNIS